MLTFNFSFTFKTSILEVPDIATEFKPSYNILLFMGLMCFFFFFLF